MKWYHLIFILIVLSSCTKSSHTESDNINIYFLKAVVNEEFIKYQPIIEQKINETIAQCQSLYSINNLDVIVSHRKSDPLIIPHLGIGGRFVDKNTIQIVMNIDFSDIDHLINTSLKRILLHEIGHIIRHRSAEIGQFLFSYIVAEGLADHFEIMMSGNKPQAWSKNLTDTQLEYYMELAEKEYWKTKFDYDEWFFGSLPWIGYSLGFKLIDDYLQQNPNTTIMELLQTKDTKIYRTLYQFSTAEP